VVQEGVAKVVPYSRVTEDRSDAAGAGTNAVGGHDSIRDMEYGASAGPGVAAQGTIGHEQEVALV